MRFGDVKPIETKYKGHRFRSRMEARWAVYFDAIKLDWEYEPEGFDLGGGVYYLPDFWLPQVRMFVEVKPTWPTEDEQMKAKLLSDQSGHPVLFLDGNPEPCNYWAYHGKHNRKGNFNCDEWRDYFVDSRWLYQGESQRRLFYLEFWDVVHSDDRPRRNPEAVLESFIASDIANGFRFNRGEEVPKDLKVLLDQYRYSRADHEEYRHLTNHHKVDQLR